MDRGARSAETPRKPFNLLLTPQQAAWLNWISRRRDMTKAAVLREALARMHLTEWTAYVKQGRTDAD